MKTSIQTVTIASVALSLVLLTTIAIAADPVTVTYDLDGEDLISIDYPSGWTVDTDYIPEAKAAGTFKDGKAQIRVVEAMPTDGTKLWIGIWTAPGVESFEDGLEYARSLGESLFTDVESTEPESTEIGEMPALTLHGTAKRQDEDVEFAMALLQAKDDLVVSVLYVGRPQTWEEHEDELQTIVDSIRPVD